MRQLTQKIHPSYVLLIFCISLIVSDIFILIFKPIFLSSSLLILFAVCLLLIAIFTARIITLPLAILAAFLLISIRAAPTFLTKQQLAQLFGRELTISGVIAKDPTESENGKFSIALTDLRIAMSSPDSTNTTTLSPPANPPPQADATSLETVISMPGSIFTQLNSLELTDGFRLQRSDHLTLRGTLTESFSSSYSATIFRPETKSAERPEPGDVFLKIREFFADKIKDYIPAPENGLALGFLLGQKSGVDQNFQSALRTVGLTHIIVASGAHLGTIISFARKIFGKFSRFASLLAAILAILLFIGITGLSASMLRAGLVTGISLLCWYFGRKPRPVNLILIVATITLIIDPSYLIDLAWLLSFASFTGIMIVAPAITKFFYGKSRQPNFIFSTIITSLSAALLCTPILLYFFGQTSLISILANLLILPTVSVVMGLSFLTGLFALFLPPLANLFGHLATLLLDYQISVVNFFGEQKLFLIEIDPENPVVFALYIPLVVVILIKACYSRYKLLKSRRQKSLCLAGDQTSDS